MDDDEYDDYEMYEDAPAVSQPVQRPRAAPDPSAVPSVRPLPNERDFDNGGVTLQPVRPAVVRPVPVHSTRVHVVAPKNFGDAQEIGERLKNAGPVIVNLQGVEPDLSRRLIDFCSGAVFVAGAKMQKVADRVFLMTPSNVEVSDEEMRRLQERGLYTPKD
ncbi:MAG: cell division protein SepF [Acidimicrobiales bacterium]